MHMAGPGRILSVVGLWDVVRRQRVGQTLLTEADIALDCCTRQVPEFAHRAVGVCVTTTIRADVAMRAFAPSDGSVTTILDPLAYEFTGCGAWKGTIERRRPVTCLDGRTRGRVNVSPQRHKNCACVKVREPGFG